MDILTNLISDISPDRLPEIQQTDKNKPKADYPRGTHIRTPDPSELSSPWKHGIAIGNKKIIARKGSEITIMELKEFFTLPCAEVITHDYSVYTPDEIVARAMDIVVKSRSSGIIHLDSFWTSEVFDESFDSMLMNRNLAILNEYISVIMRAQENQPRERRPKQRVSPNFFSED